MSYEPPSERSSVVNLTHAWDAGGTTLIPPGAWFLDADTGALAAGSSDILLFDVTAGQCWRIYAIGAVLTAGASGLTMVLHVTDANLQQRVPFTDVLTPTSQHRRFIGNIPLTVIETHRIRVDIQSAALNDRATIRIFYIPAPIGVNFAV